MGAVYLFSKSKGTVDTEQLKTTDLGNKMF